MSAGNECSTETGRGLAFASISISTHGIRLPGGQFSDTVRRPERIPTLVRAHIKLGRIAGIAVGLHYSWFIIALLIPFSLADHFHSVTPQWNTRVVWTSAIITCLLFFAALFCLWYGWSMSDTETMYQWSPLLISLAEGERSACATTSSMSGGLGFDY